MFNEFLVIHLLYQPKNKLFAHRDSGTPESQQVVCEVKEKIFIECVASVCCGCAIQCNHVVRSIAKNILLSY
jgi:hypothetical protein